MALPLEMDEMDLNGILFVNYPDYISLEKSRELLEYEIEMVADEENGKLPEADADCAIPPSFSYYWCFMALRRRPDPYEPKDPIEREAYRQAVIDRTMAYRKKYAKEIAAKTICPFPNPLPLPDLSGRRTRKPNKTTTPQKETVK